MHSPVFRVVHYSSELITEHIHCFCTTVYHNYLACAIRCYKLNNVVFGIFAALFHLFLENYFCCEVPSFRCAASQLYMCYFICAVVSINKWMINFYRLFAKWWKIGNNLKVVTVYSMIKFCIIQMSDNCMAPVQNPQ